MGETSCAPGAARGPRVDLASAIDLGNVTGTWTVRRRILDHRAGAVHRFDGSAVVTTTAFSETGTLHSGGAAFRTTRSYRLAATHGGLTVCYADGRLFFELKPETASTILHSCGNDLYQGRIVVRHPDRWVESWRVRGPAKDYWSLSRYERSPAEPASIDPGRVGKGTTRSPDLPGTFSSNRRR